MKKYILVGLGPHAKRIYYPLLEKHQAAYDIKLKLIIDLETQSSSIKEYISKRKLQPESLLYIPDNESNRLGQQLDPQARKELDALVQKEKIDGMIISTEPKAHNIYATWAITNNINVLMDKPITAPLYPTTDLRAARQIYTDYLNLIGLLGRSRSKCYVMCQRRNHEGYMLIKKYLEDFITTYEIPISYIDIYHADGTWNLPHEFNKENHPYKYGYGKLAHSGYHFIDLFAWLTQSNFRLQRAKPEDIQLYTARFSPADFFHQIPEKIYQKLFNQQATRHFFQNYIPEKYTNFGELDAYTLIQLKNNRRVVTTGSINLQQNSLSNRGWFDLPRDTYKGNGRLRLERVNIQASHFLNIQVHSYQSQNTDHFDIHVARNAAMIGGERFQKITLGEEMRKKNNADQYYLGHNEQARETGFLRFINSRDDASELQHHDFTNQLLSQIYASIATSNK